MTNDNSCRVLIADDDKLVRGLLSSMLSVLGADVVGEAENGVEAVQAFEKYAPDLTLLDINMPVRDGIGALEDIMARDPNAIVVMLSATSDMEVAERGVNAGARNYVRKGATPDALTIMLKSALELVNGN